MDNRESKTNKSNLLQGDAINIAVGIDDNFAKQLAVLLYSICVNLKDKRLLRIFLVCNERLSSENKDRIRETIKGFNTEYIVISDGNDYKNLKTNKDFSEAIYFRINLPRILPEAIEKVLYLDSDIVANGDIGELYDMSVNFIRAVRDPETILQDYYDLLFKAKNKRGYFNAGVMLLNLKKLREIHASRLMMEYLEKNSHSIIMCDQTALNLFFYDKYESMSPKYNFIQCISSLRNIEQRVYDREDYQEAKERPISVHYTGRKYKPWLFESIGQYRYLFDKYLEKISKPLVTSR